MMKNHYLQGTEAALAKYAAHLPPLEKQAFIAKLLRTLATPVERAPLLGRALQSAGVTRTPGLLMAHRGPAELDALENAARSWQQTHVHNNIYKGLKGVKLDKLYQKLEPYTGSTSEPSIRAQYGDRRIWSLAHQPLQHALSAPVQYLAGKLPIVGPAAKAGVVDIYNSGRAVLEKHLGVPGPLPYGAKPGSNAVTTAPAAVPTGRPPAASPPQAEPRILR